MRGGLYTFYEGEDRDKDENNQENRFMNAHDFSVLGMKFIIAGIFAHDMANLYLHQLQICWYYFSGIKREKPVSASSWERCIHPIYGTLLC